MSHVVNTENSVSIKVHVTNLVSYTSLYIRNLLDIQNLVKASTPRFGFSVENYTVLDKGMNFIICSFITIFTLTLLVQETWTAAVPSETTATESQPETTIESQTEATTLCWQLTQPHFTLPCATFSFETCRCETDERCPHVGPPG